ncbi:MAG TPA: DUF5668 domain-containing protein [Bacteroidales bacterium]|nr:DUF5668 domain-containing protein [Bacteroidales bacterium]HPS16336.1 DUF5668 domain-containing protein [Bacteroidales bacterium]
METTTYFCSKHRRMKKIITAILFIVAGSLLLAFNTGVLPHEYKHIFFSWEMFLIAIGVVNLFAPESRMTGIILILIGGFFILPDLFSFPFEYTHTFWPALIIIIGIMMLVKRVWHHPFNHHSYSETKVSDGYIDETNVFGGNKMRLSPVEFKGGKITNIFGGSDIDLTQTTLPEGEHVLEITCIFGGTAIRVPSDWNVQSQMTSILGGVGDKRFMTKNANEFSKSKLIIKGVAIFGGCEIKN